jgi:hypothetical protein
MSEHMRDRAIQLSVFNRIQFLDITAARPEKPFPTNQRSVQNRGAHEDSRGKEKTEHSRIGKEMGATTI